jgi:hypothetical protein
MARPCRRVRHAAEPVCRASGTGRHPDRPVSRLEYYQNKVVMLGGAIIEEKRERERIWLKLCNRPLEARFRIP